MRGASCPRRRVAVLRCVLDDRSQLVGEGHNDGIAGELQLVLGLAVQDWRLAAQSLLPAGRRPVAVPRVQAGVGVEALLVGADLVESGCGPVAAAVRAHPPASRWSRMALSSSVSFTPGRKTAALAVLLSIRGRHQNRSA